jgi:hypothetical protein
MTTPSFRLLAACVLFSGAVAWSQPSEVSGQGPTVKHLVAVEYPWIARLAALEGKVELTALVSAEGTVTKVIEVKGPDPLVLAAKTAVMKWQFAGCEAECRIKFVASFLLHGSCYASENCPTRFEFDSPGTLTVISKSINAIVN